MLVFYVVPFSTVKLSFEFEQIAGRLNFWYVVTSGLRGVGEEKEKLHGVKSYIILQDFLLFTNFFSTINYFFS